MKELYGIDMEEKQFSKTYDKIPTPDIAISMGCDVGCPYIGRYFDDNWGLPDPTGQSDEHKQKQFSSFPLSSDLFEDLNNLFFL